MSEISLKYRTGQRQTRSRLDDVIEQDTRSRCKTQTNLRTRPKPATRLQLGHKLNNTNSEIESAKAKRGDRTRYDELIY